MIRKKSITQKCVVVLTALCLALCACGNPKETTASPEEQVTADELKELQEQLLQQQKELAEQQEKLKQEQLEQQQKLEEEQRKLEEEQRERQRQQEIEQEMNTINNAYYNLFSQIIAGNIRTRSYYLNMDTDSSLMYYFYKLMEGNDYYGTYGYIFSNMSEETKAAFWNRTISECSCNYSVNAGENGGYYISATLSNKNTVSNLIEASNSFLSDKLRKQSSDLKESSLMGALEGFDTKEGFLKGLLGAAKGAAKSAAFDFGRSFIADMSGQESGTYAENISQLYDTYLSRSQQLNSVVIYFDVETDDNGNYIVPDTIMLLDNNNEPLYYTNENAVYLLEYLVLGLPF